MHAITLDHIEPRLIWSNVERRQAAFDELIREFRRLDSNSISVPMPADPDGYFDRECPSGECLFQFKFHQDDWAGKVRDEEVFCPLCGHNADSSKWWTQEQIKHAEEDALARIQQHLGHAMRRDADNWNRRQRRDSFLSITMKVDSRSQRVLFAPGSRRSLLRSHAPRVHAAMPLSARLSSARLAATTPPI
jgi:hypothetical protein